MSVLPEVLGGNWRRPIYGKREAARLIKAAGTWLWSDPCLPPASGNGGGGRGTARGIRNRSRCGVGAGAAPDQAGQAEAPRLRRSRGGRRRRGLGGTGRLLTQEFAKRSADTEAATRGRLTERVPVHVSIAVGPTAVLERSKRGPLQRPADVSWRTPAAPLWPQPKCKLQIRKALDGVRLMPSALTRSATDRVDMH